MNTRAVAGMIIISSILVLVGPVHEAGSGGALVPDPEFDPGLGPDVPTWRMGDFWNYSSSFTVSYLGFNVPVSGWMNMSTAITTLDFTYRDSPVYITDIRGNLTCRVYIPILGIDETIYVNLTGYVWERVQDLSLYRMVLNASVTGTIGSVNGNYPFGYEYFPAMEQYDFPLIPGERWEVNVSARMPFGGSGDLVTVLQNMSCAGQIEREVPAGKFMTFPVLSEGVPVLYYNGTVGNTVERVFDLDIQGLELTVPWTLRRFHRSSQESRIRVWIDQSQPVLAGSSFYVKGELSFGNTLVTLFFPGGQIAASIPLVGPELTFTRTLTAPMQPDDTPTDIDYGSFGVLAVVGALDELDVCTVTTKALDLVVDEGSLGVRYSGEGTEDDEFSADIVIHNPMNHGTGVFSYQLLNGSGSVVHSGRLEGLEAREDHRTTIPLGRMEAGPEILRLVIDHQDEVDEVNESNNEVSIDFTVKERTPLVIQSSTPSGNITRLEGEWVNISAEASRGDVRLPTGNWTLDGMEVEWDGDLNLSIGYSGPLSARPDPYEIVYNVNPSYLHEGENGSLAWNLSVIDVNRAPRIDSFSPQQAVLEVPEGTVVVLSVEVSDPDMTVPLLEWKMNGETGLLRPSGGSSVEFVTHHTGQNSSGGSPYLVEVLVFDEKDTTLNLTHNWTIIVVDVDRSPTVNITPPPGPLIVEYNLSLDLRVVVEDPDDDPFFVKWYLDDRNVGEGPEFTFSPKEQGLEGDETVVLELELVVGGFEATYNWTILVLPPEEPEEPAPLPPAGVDIVSPGEGDIFNSTDTIIFRAVHADGRPLRFTWYINGSFYEGSEVSIEGLAPGSYIAVLNVSTEGPPPGWIETTVGFNVVLPHDGDTGPGDDGSDPFPWWLLAVLFIGIAVIAGMVALAFVRRKDEGSEE